MKKLLLLLLLLLPLAASAQSNQKISQMPSATLPLAGGELFPIVQGGVNKTINAANLYAAIGQGGITTQSIINSGTTAPLANLNSFNGWKSATTGNKTQPIPTSLGTLAIIIITDIQGTAGTYPITAVPVSGSINGNAQVYTSFGSITLIDTTAGWVSI